MKSFRLSLLEFGLVGPGQTPSQVLRAICDNAPRFEAMGFHRLWLAEHHESRFAFAVPELLIPSIAMRTNRMRVGTAGVLMQFHSPLRIAESFRMLEAQFPGRIDCGVASGVTASPEVREDLQAGFDLEAAIKSRQYADRVERLIALSRNTTRYAHPHYTGVSPEGQRSPPITLLGAASGRGNQILASRHGTAFCYSLVHGPHNAGPEICQEYRNAFEPSVERTHPHLSIAVSIVCARTNREAVERLTALRVTKPYVNTIVIGEPARCADKLREMAERFRSDEVVLIPMSAKPRDSVAGMELLAAEMA